MQAAVQVDLRVKVKTDWLTTVIQKNRDEHKQVYEKAFEKYRTALIAAMEQQLKEVKDHKRTTMTYFQGMMPQDHTIDYDLVLSMLGNTDEETITISGSDFRRFVQDRWDWTDQFVTTANSYGVTTKFDGGIDPDL